MTDRETFRLGPPVALWWTWLAFVALNVADFALQGLPSTRFAAVLGAMLLLVTGIVYTLALRPRVLASDDGITVVNPFRAHVVPWLLVTAVDTGEWVRVHYVPPDSASPSSAAGRTVSCWALYVSARSRRKIASGPPRVRDPLERGQLGGACLDVFETEPLPVSSPLWELPNVLVSPHSASTVEAENRLLTDLFIDNLRRWLAGAPLRNVYDRAAGY